MLYEVVFLCLVCVCARMLLLRFVDLVDNSILRFASAISDGRCRLFHLIRSGLTSLFGAISRSMRAFALYP